MSQPIYEQIRTRDGAILYTARFLPPKPSRSTVLIAPDMGVPMAFYAPLARWLSSHGYVVYTFDYRGVGRSRPSSLRGFEASLQHWGKFDLDAAFRHVRKRYPTEELSFIAHGLSGQLLGFTPENRTIEKAIMVASAHPFWMLWQMPYRLVQFLGSFLQTSLLAHILGFYPSSNTTPRKSIPKGVALEWSRWRRAPEGILLNYANRYFTHFYAPLVAYSFTDDHDAPKAPADKLLALFPQAEAEHIHLNPKQAGLSKIGHWGFFLPHKNEVLWQMLLYNLQNKLPGN